jgi:hypothetical protein
LVINTFLLGRPFFTCDLLANTSLIVAEDLVLYLSRGESKKYFNSKHLIFLQKLNKLGDDPGDHLFQLQTIKVELFFILGDRNLLINAFHQGVISHILCHVLIEDTQSFDLEKDPCLLCLIYNALEKAAACLNKEWVLLVVLLVL